MHLVKRLVVANFATLLVVVLAILTGCVTLPYQKARNDFRKHLSTGQYDLAQAKMMESLDLAPAPDKPELQDNMARALYRQGWRDCKQQKWDTSFGLMTTAVHYASVGLRNDWTEEETKVRHGYAVFHTNKAVATARMKNLKSAIQEYEAAIRADNAVGKEAETALNNLVILRRQLEDRLAQARQEIDREEWSTALGSITEVRMQDCSLEELCNELVTFATERHYQAACRNSKTAYGQNDFVMAFKKANEAMCLLTEHTEAVQLKQQAQNGLIDSVKGQLAQYLSADDRPGVLKIAETYDVFELAAGASTLRGKMSEREEADKNLKLAQELIADGHHEEAFDPLVSCCKFWPENQRFPALLQETRNRVAHDCLEMAEGHRKAGHLFVCAVYALKVAHVGEADKELLARAQKLATEAVADVDRRPMQASFEVNVILNRELEGTVDGGRLQEAIVNAMPKSTRFVSCGPPTDRTPVISNRFQVVVEVQTLAAATQEQTYNKVVRYVSGVTYDPNPNYAQVQSELVAAQANYVAAQNNFQHAYAAQQQAINSQRMSNAGGLVGALNLVAASAGSIGMEKAKNDMANANEAYNAAANKMRNTPPTIPRDVYSDFAYIEHAYERRGALKAMARLLSPGGRVITEKVIAENYAARDTLHEGYPPAQLEEKKLSLPSEEDIRNQLVLQLFSQAPSAAISFFLGHWRSHLESIAMVGDEPKRWDGLLSMALQVPALKNECTEQISKRIRNLPPDYLVRLDALFDDAK